MEKVDAYPLITVVIPTYNRASLLKKAVASVLGQTYSHVEIIIGDDGSTDETVQMVRAMEDPRIRIVSLPHSGHIGKIRNAAARAGNGEWIAFLDSDDEWLPRKLELQLEHVRKTRARWCYTNYSLVNINGQEIPPSAGLYVPYTGWITGKILSNEATVCIVTLLVERKLFEETGGLSEDPRLILRGDFELTIRLSLQSPVSAMPDVLTKVLEHSGRTTNALTDAYERSAVPYTMFIEQQKDEFLLRIARKQKAYLLSEAAVKRSAKGERITALRQLAGAFGKDSWRHWFSSGWRALKAAF